MAVFPRYRPDLWTDRVFRDPHYWAKREGGMHDDWSERSFAMADMGDARTWARHLDHEFRGYGRHGRGPKTYVRSDERIQHDLLERLARDEWIDSSEVDVSVHDGIVSLAGSVPDRRDKWLIDDLANSIPGVREVHLSLRVEPPHRYIRQGG